MKHEQFPQYNPSEYTADGNKSSKFAVNKCYRRFLAWCMRRNSFKEKRPLNTMYFH